MKKLGVIVVGGAGAVARSNHIPCWLKNPHTNVLALVDLNEERLKATCQSFGIKRYYTSLEEALDKEREAEIVDLATPPKVHYSHAILSLKEGKHVIMEKPMASSLEECEEIINLARKKHLKVSLFHVYKGYPVVWKIKELIAKGELGENIFISFMDSWIDEGLQSWWKGIKTAIFHEFAVHEIYVSLYWLEEVKDVKVIVHSKDEDGMIKDATVFLYGNRGISEITIFKTRREIGYETRIFGSKGKMIIPPFPTGVFKWLEMPEQRNFRKIISKEFKRLVPPFGMIREGIKYLLLREKVLAHYTILSNFVRSILYNDELIVPPEEGLETIRVLKKIDELCKDV